MKHSTDRRTKTENHASPKPLQVSPIPSHRAALVIYAKAPIPGHVKTRLCPPLTPDEAATLHGTFVQDTLERSKVAATKLKLAFDRFLACAPSSTHVFFKIMQERQEVELINQVGDDLGARMNQSFQTMFAMGYPRVLIIGTDVPSLPLDHYNQALALLESNDLVLGPALDGGFYLIGLKQAAPELFNDIPWSTKQVFALTQEKAARLGLKTALIPSWRDIDTIDDLWALIEASVLDSKRPKNEKAFTSRTCGALQHIAKQLRVRA